MCRIAVLLPEAYRGVYARHPRPQELLEVEARVAGMQKTLTMIGHRLVAPGATQGGWRA